MPRRDRTRPVPHDAYTEEYFRTAEAGFHKWEMSGGAKFGGFYEDALGIRRPRTGERVLDLGTGRGEVPVLAAEHGAFGVGIDYSASSMDLCRVTKAARGNPAGAVYARAGATHLPFRDGAFDVGYLMDFVEHLTPAELHRGLVELRRVLRPGGDVVVHTMPNRLIYDWTYRGLRWVSVAVGRRWPTEPRQAFEIQMHVNEMRRGELRRALTDAGFVWTRVWAGPFSFANFVPSDRVRRLLRRVHRVEALRFLTSAELWATAKAP